MVLARNNHTSLLLLLQTIFFTVYARQGHLEPLGNSGSVKPLEERSGFMSPPEFLKEYVLKNKPILMRGAMIDSPAITRWTDEYLMDKAANNPKVIVGVEHGKKENRKGGSQRPFSEYLKVYNTSDVYMVNSMPPYLESDMIIPWPLQCEEYKRSFEDNVMWFSSGGTKSVIHNDGHENINCLIRGKKRFLFVNTTKYQDFFDKILDVTDGTYGSVDVDKVDLDKYPFYEGMEFFKAEMNPGDCVYSPYQWIHQVESWESNIAVNMWWFRDINKLIDPSSCSKTYNRSMTFATVAFHRTTVMTDADRMEDAVFALENGIARIVFPAAGLKEVTLNKFIRAMVNNKRKINREHFRSLVSLFHQLDKNRNKKFDVEDLSKSFSDQNAERFHQEGVEWVSSARIFNYPLPADFSNDAYRSTKQFSVDEIPQSSHSSDKEKSAKSKQEDESEQVGILEHGEL